MEKPLDIGTMVGSGAAASATAKLARYPVTRIEAAVADALISGRKQRHFAPRFGAPVAALDLGTNNCRLLVARPAGISFRVVDAFSRIVRLGEGLTATGALSEDAIARTLDALKVLARFAANCPMRRADRHQITDADDTGWRFMSGFENQRVASIASPGTVRLFARSDMPAPVALVAKQRGKARVAVKMWPAQPVDCAVARYQRRTAAIADQGVILGSVFSRSGAPFGSEPLQPTQR